MGWGFNPWAINWMESRWENVVLPEDEGPATIINFLSGCLAICSASVPIFRSIKASATRMTSLILPCATASFNAPMVPISIFSPHSADSRSTWNSLWEGENFAGTLVFLSGNSTTNPSSYRSSPKYFRYPVSGTI